MSIDADLGLLDYSTRPARLPHPVDPANDNLEISLDTRVRMFELQQVLRQFEKRATTCSCRTGQGQSHLSLAWRRSHRLRLGAAARRLHVRHV